eukprot:m.4416 g.4416  ORF g.4416 m.4416 type:complete len:416 (+) comp2225_c1_seq1:103-1350(+)
MRVGAVCVVFAVCLLFIAQQCMGSNIPKVDTKCDICRKLVEKFVKGMETTAHKNFDGGNSEWQEKSLGSYATSETRLAEILEGSCSSKSDYKCLSLLEEGEEAIEEWFVSRNVEEDDNAFDVVKSLLCDKTLKICCPKGRFGKKCKPCPGGTDQPCRDRGLCNGEGTTRGTGKCECFKGYKGNDCAKCKKGFFMDFTMSDDMHTEIYCRPCHESCLACTGDSAEKCKECARGYEMDGLLCADRDECKAEKHDCKSWEYCVNEPGTYSCSNCHEACDRKKGCRGAEAWQCKKCAKGFERKKDGKRYSPCVDIDECATGMECGDNEFCDNLPGSAVCRACSNICDSNKGCDGPGAKGCFACATNGFVLDEETGKGCVRVGEDDGVEVAGIKVDHNNSKEGEGTSVESEDEVPAKDEL